MRLRRRPARGRRARHGLRVHVPRRQAGCGRIARLGPQRGDGEGVRAHRRHHRAESAHARGRLPRRRQAGVHGRDDQGAYAGRVRGRRRTAGHAQRVRASRHARRIDRAPARFSRASRRAPRAAHPARRARRVHPIRGRVRSIPARGNGHRAHPRRLRPRGRGHRDAHRRPRHDLSTAELGGQPVRRNRRPRRRPVRRGARV